MIPAYRSVMPHLPILFCIRLSPLLSRKHNLMIVGGTGLIPEQVPKGNDAPDQKEDDSEERS